MFVSTGQNVISWANYAKEIKEELSDDKLDFANKYPIEQLGIILYIESLFGKWCPYDTLEWIFEY